MSRGTIATLGNRPGNSLFFHTRRGHVKAPSRPSQAFGNDEIVFRGTTALSIPSSELSSPQSNLILPPDLEHSRRSLGNTDAGKVDTARLRNSRLRSCPCLNHNFHPG